MATSEVTFSLPSSESSDPLLSQVSSFRVGHEFRVKCHGSELPRIRTRRPAAAFFKLISRSLAQALSQTDLDQPQPGPAPSRPGPPTD